MVFSKPGKGCVRPARWIAITFLFFISSVLSWVSTSAQSSLPPLLAITPSTLTLLTGETATLSVIDQSGYPANSAEWSVSPRIAEIVSGDKEAQLLAREPGQAVVTATFGGESATALVTVVSIHDLRDAALRWSVLPIPGFETVRALPAMPSQVSDVAFYSIEGNKSENALLRAFKDSGQQLWMKRLSSSATSRTFDHVLPPSGEIYLNGKLVSDHSVFIIGEKSFFAGNTPTDPSALGLPLDGKAVLLHIEGDFSGGIQLLERGRFRDSLVDIAADGHETWRYNSDGRLAQTWTSNYDNNVAIVETLSKPTSSSLIVLNALTGQVRFKVPFPLSSSTINGFQCTDVRHNILTSLRPSGAGAIFTNSDSDIYIQVETHFESQELQECKEKQWSFDDKIALLRVTPDGQTEWKTFERVHADGVGHFHVQSRLFAGETIPDGFGGVLAAWTMVYPDQPIRSEARLSRMDSNTQRDFTLPLIFWTPGLSSYFAENMVLGDGNVLYATNGLLLIRFDTQTGESMWQRHPPTGKVRLQYATAGGGVLVSNAGEIVYFDADGNGMPVPWTAPIPNSEAFGLVRSDPLDHTTLPPLPLRSLQLAWDGNFIAVEDGPPLGRGSLISFSAP